MRRFIELLCQDHKPPQPVSLAIESSEADANFTGAAVEVSEAEETDLADELESPLDDRAPSGEHRPADDRAASKPLRRATAAAK
jgi:hypothetical protein